MFSVIIPVHNKAKYVLNTIQSVINQTYKDFELILINDGSTDDSYDIIEKFCNGLKKSNSTDYLKIRIFDQPNKGVSITRNNGAEYAKYPYLAFLDADDWWENNFLEEMYSLINEYKEASVWGTGYFKIKNQQKIKSKIGLPINFEKGYINYFKVYSENFYYMPLWIGSTVIKKESLKKVNGFREYLKWGEDFDFWIRMALNFKIAFLNKHLSNYNHDVGNEERAMNNLLHPAAHDFLFNTNLYSQEEKMLPELKVLFDKFRTYSLLQYYLDENRRKEAILELKKVNWKHQPVSVRLKYTLPVGLIKVIYKIKASLSMFKNMFKTYLLK